MCDDLLGHLVHLGPVAGHACGVAHARHVDGGLVGPLLALAEDGLALEREVPVTGTESQQAGGEKGGDLRSVLYE